MTDVPLPIAGQGPAQPTGARLALTLGLAGVLSGAVLAGAYQLTRPAIEANQARAMRAAVFKVVPGSTRLQGLAVRDGRVVAVGEGAPDEQASPEGGSVGGAPALYAAYGDDGGFLGYAIPAEGPGFQDTIRVLFGYDPARRRITGMEVLESRETPGLGDRIYKDADFRANFESLAVEPEIVLVKGGRGADNEVDAITGATISSRSVVKILNAAAAEWLSLLPPPGSEAPLAEVEREAAPRPASGGPDAPAGSEGG